MKPKAKIEWKDAGREPQCAPNALYPDGIDIDASGGAARTCKVPLPYPAKRCGAYVVTCQRCGYRAAVTTAGRPDDPRSVRLPCYGNRMGTP
jgi:hypothetical protein